MTPRETRQKLPSRFCSPWKQAGRGSLLELAVRARWFWSHKSLEFSDWQSSDSQSQYNQGQVLAA